MASGYLILETEEIFEGTLLGSHLETTGEVVFNTGMTGYQEMMTDPSYAGQILVFCYPLIGNYGVNGDDHESIRLSARGIVTGEICPEPSFYKAEATALQFLEKSGVPCLTGVDTRALVKTIRKRGTVNGIITADAHASVPKKEEEEFLIAKVSTDQPLTYGDGPLHIVLMDFGYKKSILNYLLQQHCKVTVVPFDFTAKQMKMFNPDGVVFSNGPGDPAKLLEWLPEIKKISMAYPVLGICLGHQLLALAYGAKTKKLPFGHRGGNHPVKDLRNGKVLITAQNHGYVVDEASLEQSEMNMIFRNVNDGTVEGCVHPNLPIATVQFHPEAHPGPQDSEYIFKQFLQKVQQRAGVMSYAIQ
ncbi:carbamoyl phosphate synthase small subunit [Heyndrickxia acidiproducens]|uniref:carbamoyl phosphate synthase small subunit n=1 Tax=Heyndrickxia acidiproducens TaxID=1121084 RepID=UPI0003724E93|nr:carbamoyl phosphate synthase small subunit [Heyndrickxia acidiproducens]